MLIVVCGSVIDGFLFVLLGLLICGKLEVAIASFQFIRAGEVPACGSNWKLQCLDSSLVGGHLNAKPEIASTISFYFCFFDVDNYLFSQN